MESSTVSTDSVPAGRLGSDVLEHPAPSRHVPALDGVRGLAVLMVMFFHYESRRFDLHFPGWGLVLDGFRFGWSGVDLFFVLSGFLITGILWDSKERPRYFRNFYARRTLRIFPLYYAFLLLIYALLPILGAVSTTRAGTQIWYWTYTSNILIALKGWGVSGRFTPHFWSLAVEEQFYLMWPLVVLLVSRRAGETLCGIVIVAALALRCWAAGLHDHLTATYVLTPTRTDTLAVGALFALAVRGTRDIGALLRRWRPAGVVLLAALAGMIRWRGGPEGDRVVATVGFTLVALVFGWFLAEAYFATRSGLLARALTNWPLTWVGRRSYALYIFHYPILGGITAAGLGLAPIRDRLGSAVLAQLVFLTVNIGLSALAAQLSWVLLERRCLRLKGRFA